MSHQVKAPLSTAVDQTEGQMLLVRARMSLKHGGLLPRRERGHGGKLEVLLILSQVVDELHLVLGQAEGAKLGLAAAAILEHCGALLERRDIL